MLFLEVVSSFLFLLDEDDYLIRRLQQLVCKRRVPKLVSIIISNIAYPVTQKHVANIALVPTFLALISPQLTLRHRLFKILVLGVLIFVIRHVTFVILVLVYNLRILTRPNFAKLTSACRASACKV